MIEKYIVKREETVRRIENIYADRRNFISSDCAIDALLLVDGNTLIVVKGVATLHKYRIRFVYV